MLLLGGNLGFLCSAVVVLIGWFFARRKWRRVVARREEVRRLMVMVSEETARAELEAAAGYSSYDSAQAPAMGSAEVPVVGSGSSSGRQLRYQCEVCFSPTLTRCKQCKAVRYCSRKCQVIHWREGHKDECLSLITHQNFDAELCSRSKEFKQDEYRSSQHVIGGEATHNTKPVELLSGEHMFSNPALHVLGENNCTEFKTRDDWKGTGTKVKKSVQSLPDDYSSSANPFEGLISLDSNLKDSNRYGGQSTDINDESMKPLSSNQPNLTNHACTAAASSVSNQLKSGCIDIDENSESSTSSVCSATGSEEHLFAEPSTPTSDFCSATGSEEHLFAEPSTPTSDFRDGSVKPIRSKSDALDEFCDVDISSSHSSCLQSPSRVNVHVETLGSDTNRIMRDDPSPSISIPNKSTGLSELSADGSESRASPFLSSKLPGQIGVSNTSTEFSSTEEAKLTSFTARREHVSEGNVPSKHVVNVSDLESLAQHKELGHEIDGTNDDLDATKENDSSRRRSSEVHLSSTTCNEKSFRDQSGDNDFVHVDEPLSLDSSRSQSAESGTNASTRRDVGQLGASNLIRHGSFGIENEIRGKHEGVSFSYELFVKLYNWNEIELYPHGLKNCGNSCYANAVLQCLTFTPPLTAYFLKGLHASACEKKEWCFTCELEALVKKAKEGNSLLSPDRIVSQLQHIGSHLSHGREEDAHEFLRYAIEAMQFVCLKEAGVNMRSSLDEETTLLGLTFGGYLRSKIECMRCGNKSKQCERIMDLTVEIGGEIGSLEDALRQFTHSEILDGENKYHCGSCHSYVKAKKKLRVLEAPNVLTIALKRFQSGKFGKLNKAVKFPAILNLAQYMSGTSDKSPIYQLYGVVVHLDNMNATYSGHYICYVKNNRGRWYKADDSVVRVVELENVLSKDAYMLFYSRCSPRAPRLVRSSMVPRDLRKAKGQPCKSKSRPGEAWDVSGGGLRDDACSGYAYRNHPSYCPTRPNSEDDTLSEYSSFFSEVGSHSTETSNGESTSTSDNFDQILGDMGNCWSAPCRSTSDSDTTSSSSSRSSLRIRYSPLANMNRYSSDAETSGLPSVSNMEADRFWAGSSSTVVASASKRREATLFCSSSKESEVGNSSSKDRKSNRLGSNNSRDNVKGVYI